MGVSVSVCLSVWLYLEAEPRPRRSVCVLFSEPTTVIDSFDSASYRCTPLPVTLPAMDGWWLNLWINEGLLHWWTDELA